MSSLTNISGRSSIFVIVADPIHHVKTPQLFNRVLTERGIDGVLVPLHATADNLDLTFKTLGQMANLRGIVITVPHKIAAMRACRDVSLRAKQCGAINVARRNLDGTFSGENFDGFGFVRGLTRAGNDPVNSKVFMAGAGGAAQAIAVSLAEHGFKRLTLHNRTEAKSEELRTRLHGFFPTLDIATGHDPAGHDLVINATSLGLLPGDDLPLDVSRLTPDMTVAEVIMDPRETKLLEIAIQTGCRVHHGMAMLEEQINLLVDFLI